MEILSYEEFMNMPFPRPESSVGYKACIYHTEPWECCTSCCGFGDPYDLRHTKYQTKKKAGIVARCRREDPAKPGHVFVEETE